MGDRDRWAGPSYFDHRTDSFGDGLELGPATQALREALRRVRDLVPREAAGPGEEMIDALRRLTAIETAIDAERALLIAEASYHGVTWKVMAAACGVTKQSLHKRYAGVVGRLIAICADPHPEKPLRLIMELHPGTLKRLLHLNILVPAPARQGESWRPGYRRDLTSMAIAKKQAADGREQQKCVPPARLPMDGSKRPNDGPLTDASSRPLPLLPSPVRLDRRRSSNSQPPDTPPRGE
ncbi:hypothetical protein ACF1FX_22690 [Streptomyces sp. NPDC014646]|uniref:hypothetical protein n=1 Tax=unclassified Streptomyces TaxID=2593676 RepID=UPI003701866D